MIEHSLLDRTYGALADSTRRGMLVTLRDGPARITDLAAPLPISFAAVARHVAVLEAAGLIEREVRGRDHWLTVRSAGLRPAEEWIAEQVSFWSPRADARLGGDRGTAGRGAPRPALRAARGTRPPRSG
jgi:DNA-binding transcriptional ArsR family regulator